MALGYVFISADYQLLPAATGHDIVEDVKDLFNFLSDTEIKSESGAAVKIDISRVAVTGSSAGGLCAYLASIHCSPRPKALVSLYGMGGDVLARSSHRFLPRISAYPVSRRDITSNSRPRSLTENATSSTRQISKNTPTHSRKAASAASQ
jgi:acetyl esterase/lipase